MPTHRINGHAGWFFHEPFVAPQVAFAAGRSLRDSTCRRSRRARQGDAITTSPQKRSGNSAGAPVRPVDREPRGLTAEVSEVSRLFDGIPALENVSLGVARGEVHALLGPNGAGKTTVLRLLTALLEPTSGRVRVLGRDVGEGGRSLLGLVGLVPSGDRSFYLRISGLENLVFFARLHGLRRRAAIGRARAVLADVGLEAAAAKPVGEYSHGMQKRLSLARALLTEPELLLVDEATHDLDPAAARHARELVRAVAERGAGVLFTTQRVEEIRGFADRVTVLSGGHVRFIGTVPGLMAHASPQRFVVQLRNGHPQGPELLRLTSTALGPLGSVAPLPGESSGHYLLALAGDVVVGEAITALSAAKVEVLTCREERPEIEDAFLTLT
jgi:ABC-2 type transport system ATP-binding protein